jgi:AcrR family transcriptional regulator
MIYSYFRGKSGLYKAVLLELYRRRRDIERISRT